MNISDICTSKVFFICIGIALLCISFASATVYLKDGIVLEETEEDTLIADYLAMNEEPQRIILFTDPNCGSCQKLRPWIELFVQVYPGIIEEYDITLAENKEILNECKIAFSHARLLTPSIFVEGVDGSGFVLEGVASIELYLEPLVLGMYDVDAAEMPEILWSEEDQAWVSETDDGSVMLFTDEGWVFETDDGVAMLFTDEGWVSETEEPAMLWNEKSVVPAFGIGTFMVEDGAAMEWSPSPTRASKQSFAAGDTVKSTVNTFVFGTFSIDSAGGVNSFDSANNFNQFSTEEFNAINERGFVSPLIEPLSTFASSVDTASYSLVRAKLSRGERVSPDMVRIEEFINYFTYDYPQPTDGAPLAISAELGYCPWAKDHLLLQIGVQAEKVDMSDAPPSNLVFLIDVSGSMQSSDRLGLVRQSFMLLTENLRDIDRVSIVTYAGSEATLLDGVSGEDKAKIMSVIESLEAGGITNGAGGIEAAYDCAERNFITGGINRVILATDGDFNVGITSAGELSRLISEKRDTGVFLSVLGYGMGNYKDNKMETLAKDGNGNAYYIDSLLEARRVLIEQMGATLNTIAKDVKLQVEFNPNGVKAYRLLGYENRMLNAEDFNDDSVHAGAIGSGHSVTALYEIIPAGSDEEVPGLDLKYQKRSTTPSDELLNIAVRYKLPDEDESSRIDHPVTLAELRAIPSDNMLWACAVAEFALSLRQPIFAPDASIEGALELARSADYRSDPYRAELVEMIKFLADSADL